MIRLSNVDKAYRANRFKKVVLDNVSIEFDPGHAYGILGLNGAGKSTLLRLIAGEIRADDGEVRITDGVRVAKLAQELGLSLTTSTTPSYAVTSQQS